MAQAYLYLYVTISTLSLSLHTQAIYENNVPDLKVLAYAKILTAHYQIRPEILPKELTQRLKSLEQAITYLSENNKLDGHLAATIAQEPVLIDTLLAAVDYQHREQLSMSLLFSTITAESMTGFEFLINHGVDSNKPWHMSGYTPLHWAAHEGKRDFVKALIKQGAQLNALTNPPFGSRTPLDIAQKKHYSTIVALLRKANRGNAHSKKSG